MRKEERDTKRKEVKVVCRETACEYIEVISLFTKYEHCIVTNYAHYRILFFIFSNDVVHISASVGGK